MSARLVDVHAELCRSSSLLAAAIARRCENPSRAHSLSASHPPPLAWTPPLHTQPWPTTEERPPRPQHQRGSAPQIYCAPRPLNALRPQPPPLRTAAPYPHRRTRVRLIHSSAAPPLAAATRARVEMSRSSPDTRTATSKRRIRAELERLLHHRRAPLLHHLRRIQLPQQHTHRPGINHPPALADTQMTAVESPRSPVHLPPQVRSSRQPMQIPRRDSEASYCLMTELHLLLMLQRMEATAVVASPRSIRSLVRSVAAPAVLVTSACF